MKTEKKKTIEVLDIMIQHADKGPSGFWVDDYEGCGNPKIFPEFEEGLKRGRLVQKEHYLCPWNTAVMYGNGRGNIHTGCYHSCSIEKAKYLSADMLKSILKRFKDSMSSGKYDDKDKITPLLTTSEIEYIEEQEKKEKRLEEERYKAKRAERIKRAAKLIQKYPEHKELFASCYGEKVLAQTYDGNIDFNPNGYADVVGAEKFTYDDYIDVQIRSFHKTRGWFATCFYNIPLSFKGTIERKTKDNICFERIFVEGMYPDGLCFDGKEEHVWMSLLVCGSCGGSFRRTSKSAKGKTTYYWRCVSRIEHGKTYCKDSAGIEEQMLHEAICRCLSKMMVNSGEVFSLIQSNLSYAVSGNNAALDVFSIEKQMNELKVDIQQMTELAARTEGDPERYEVELKKMFDQLVILRGKLDLAKSQASQSDTVNAEVARIMDILKQTDMNFTEFDDVTVRRLVECIQVCGNKKIIVTLKGGYQAEEELRKIEVA